jgi:6,7-dimethyl-8-ribityllumazine synthase
MKGRHRIAIIMSDFNTDITKRMLDFALKTAKKLSLEVIDVVHVPGAFEIPFAMKNYLKKNRVDGVAVLGAVIQGETEHDIVVVHNAARGVMDCSLQHNMPLGFGIMGPRTRTETARKNAEEYSVRAIEALAKMMDFKA